MHKITRKKRDEGAALKEWKNKKVDCCQSKPQYSKEHERIVTKSGASKIHYPLEST